MTTTNNTAEEAAHAREERSIDDIAVEIRDNGYSGLSDAEIDRYITFKTEVEARQGAFEAACEANRQKLQEVHDAQQAIADAAIKRLQALAVKAGVLTEGE